MTNGQTLDQARLSGSSANSSCLTAQRRVSVLSDLRSSVGEVVRAAVQRIERGKVIAVTTLLKIADTQGIARQPNRRAIPKVQVTVALGPKPDLVAWRPLPQPVSNSRIH